MSAGTASPYFVETLPLAFYYDTKYPVPIPVIVKALSSLDRISVALPAFFSSLSGAKIDGCEIKVSKIESGSLKETFELGLRFLTDDERQKFKRWLTKTKMGNITRIAGAGAFAAAAVLVVASSGLNLVNQFSGTNAPTITANNSNVIVAGGDVFNVSQKQLEDATEAGLKLDRKKIAAASLDFVKPAAGADGGIIYAGEQPSKAVVQISQAAATDAPDKVDFSAGDHDVDYVNVAVDIRNLNRDADTGWLAVIPTIAKRKKLTLSFDPAIDLTKAKREQHISADLTVTYTQDPNKGAMVPKSVLVTKIY